MLTYILPGYNSYKIRTAQILSGSNYLNVAVQNMLTNDDYQFALNPGQWTYDPCESIADISFNLDIALNPIVGDEYRVVLSPGHLVSSSLVIEDPVWHGSLQVFASQSVDKVNYVNQIPLDGDEISHTSINEYVIMT